MEVRKVKSSNDFEVAEKLLVEIEGIDAEGLYANYRRTKPTWFYLFLENDRPFGIVELYDEEDPSELYFTNFGVLFELQYEGFGKKMISWLESHAREEGYKSLRLTATPFSSGFYEKCNFTRMENREFGYRKEIGLQT